MSPLNEIKGASGGIKKLLWHSFTVCTKFMDSYAKLDSTFLTEGNNI